MNAMVVAFCQQSGCSLLEILYAVNKALPEDKRYMTSDQIFEFYNEWLERLAENEDVEKDAEIEQKFIDLLVKRLEKILAVQKPDKFKDDVLSNVDL